MEEQLSTIKPKLPSIGELFQDSLAIFKQKFWQLLALMFFAFLSGILTAGGFFLSVLPLFGLLSENDYSAWIFLGSLFGLVLIVLGIYLSIMFSVGLLVVIKEKDQTLDFFEILKKSRKYIANYIFVSIFVSILLVLWYLLLIIPGIIMSVYYSFVYYVLVFEDRKGTRETIKRSKELVKDYWWAVAGRMFAVYILVYLILSIPFWFLQEGSAAYSLWNLIYSLVNFGVAPFFMIYMALIYKNLVKIKDGK